MDCWVGGVLHCWWEGSLITFHEKIGKFTLRISHDCSVASTGEMRDIPTLEMYKSLYSRLKFKIDIEKYPQLAH